MEQKNHKREHRSNAKREGRDAWRALLNEAALALLTPARPTPCAACSWPRRAPPCCAAGCACARRGREGTEGMVGLCARVLAALLPPAGLASCHRRRRRRPRCLSPCTSARAGSQLGVAVGLVQHAVHAHHPVLAGEHLLKVLEPAGGGGGRVGGWDAGPIWWTGAQQTWVPAWAATPTAAVTAPAGGAGRPTGPPALPPPNPLPPTAPPLT